MVRQVRMREISTDSTGATTARRVFAFGTHVDALTKDYPAAGPNGPVTATAMGQSMRVIMDELLVGNALEEVACRAPIDGVNAYDRVPLGATPADIAKCSAASDILPSSCPGTFEKAVCICRVEAGCGETKFGDPVGVLDVNQDGATDDTRLILGSSGVKCGNIDVPMDQNLSYWNPSGDQNKPALGGFEALGPAMVLSPAGALPTNTECVLSFAPDVVDKQGNNICTPANGDIEAGCTAGDLTAFKFNVEALSLKSGFTNNAMGISTTMPLVVVSNAPLAPTTLSSVTVATMAGVVHTGVTISLALPTQIKLEFTTPLAPNTTYNVRITTTLTDTYGQPLPQMVTFTFTTGA